MIIKSHKMKYIVAILIVTFSFFNGHCQWHNNFHSTQDYQTKALKNNPKQKWVFKAEGNVYGPAIKEGKDLFFGDEAGYLYSLNSSKGKLNWKFKTEGKVLSCPSIKDTLAYFGSYDGYLYCLGIKSGNLIWKYKTGSGASCSPPLVKDNKVYFGSHDNYYYVTDRFNGELIQKKEIGHGNCATTSTANNFLYLADWGGYIHCLKSETLETQWKFKSKYKIYQTPVIDENQVITPSFDSIVYALDKKSGALKWKLKLNSVANQVGVKGNIAFFNTRASDLYAVNKNTGEQLWKFETEGATWGFAITAEDVIYFGSGDSKLYAVDIKSGQKLWDYKVDKAVQRPSVYNKTVYFPSGKRLYALN